MDKPTRSELNSVTGAYCYEGGLAVGLRYTFVQAGSIVESEDDRIEALPSLELPASSTRAGSARVDIP
ncbi:hypothetical protein INS49_011160 [Diaporthe citri]|uniref:uncharacterized protein n=1 Tax=Diaporthe citri TaxID=83186 RepID=UPI001C8209C0|nr:uncharacterized protein INS49_011160 [Diaporthe citri]KAG6360104.1 hypothetical protein INS49_011160 [Diaporthe citri]